MIRNKMQITQRDEVVTEVKSFSVSKMHWLGIAVSLLSTTILIMQFLETNILIQQYPKVVAGLGVAIGIAIIVLRQVTEGPVALPFESTEKAAERIKSS